ncbi:MAG: PDZ domain-containing protein, partial [Pseudomonadota bacterium]
EIVDKVAGGVVVTSVAKEGLAEEKRIIPGDIILEVGQREVSSPQDVVTRIDKLKEDGRKTALLTLSNNQGELRFTALRLEN